MSGFTSDIYEISEFLEELKKSYIDESSDTLLASLFGYMTNIHSIQIQNQVIQSSMWCDEMFPIRANLEKNIMTHAMMAQIYNFNATPARMDMLIGIRESDLLKNTKNDVFRLEKDIPIYFEEYEMHLEYSINVFRNISSRGENIYLAQYDISEENRIGTINNPYLLPPVKVRVGNEIFIYLKVRVRQVSYEPFFKKIISTSSIENKSFEFTFENKLADFELSIKKPSGEIIKFKPIYEDSPIKDRGNYVYYSYINMNTIRVKFINSVYIPSINDEITVNIYNTLGKDGNFVYNKNIMIEPISKNISYKELILIGQSITKSEFGTDRISKDEMKRQIPAALLSRGSITSNKDLENYFNMINDDRSFIKPELKVHNQIERKFYSYLLMKDINNNVIHTNTINLKLQLDDFTKIGERYILAPGEPLQYDKATDICSKLDATVLTNHRINIKETEGFLYSSPFTIVVNKNPLVLSYYLTLFDKKYSMVFKQISDIPLLQFISTSVTWKRNLQNKNKYYMNLDLSQNIDDEYNLVEVDDYGFVTPNTSKIKLVGVLHDSDGNPFRYINGNIIHYDKNAKKYKAVFEMNTDNDITMDSKIKIQNLYNIGSTEVRDGYFKSSGCKFTIYMLSDLGEKNYNNRGSLDQLVPNLENHTLCNIYEIDGGIDFFINFSNIISSVVRPALNEDNRSFHYRIEKMPAVRYSHLLSNINVNNLINNLTDKKKFIDSAITILENQFNIDFKFYNTYGISKVYKINEDTFLDRVNIGLNFKVKFINNTNSEEYVEMIKKEIKNIIENIYDIKDVHILNILSEIKSKFNFISYIEFDSINNYDTLVQSVIKDKTSIDIEVPEFININSKDISYVPDISIEVL